MGLDNGFRVKNINRQDIPSYSHAKRYNDDEIIYWRKCWGLRSVVLDALHVGEEDGVIKIEKEDIPAIFAWKETLFLS